MKNKILLVASVSLVLAMLLACGVALADSPVGSWSGTAKALGQSGGASATFKSNGSVSLSAAGISGSGTWSGGSITISAKGHTATLSYSQNGDSMTISGKYLGVKASMSLSRKGGSSEASKEAAAEKAAAKKLNALYGEWTHDNETLRLYSDGWLYYTSVTENDEGEEEWFTFTAKLSAKDGVLTLTPLETNIEPPQEGPFVWDDEAEAYISNYTIDGKELTLSADEFETVFTKTDIKLDAKPADPELINYVEFVRGDKGEAVKYLQEALIEAGYLSGSADGAFGPKTQAGVKACQADFNLEETGIANGELWEFLGK